jgi:hypothetical protein
MLDTIRIKFPIDPTEEQLKGWIRKTTSSLTGTSDVYIYNPVINDAMLKFTFRPFDFKGNPMLSLELSLPKMSFGHNYQMITNIDEAIKLGNARLDGIPHIPKLDLAEGILIRLDMCYNHQVGDAVDDYIRAIGNLEYPHRRTKYHRNEGAEFRAKHKTTKFYNKERESGFAEAHGILHQEITLINGKDIQKLFGINKPTLIDMTKEKIVEFLKDDLEKIGLLGNSIANRNTALKSLCEEHGENAGIFYYGLLMSKMDKSKKQIGKDAGTHPRSLDRKLKKIVDTGIPLTLTDREEPLPPLTIEL